MTAGQWTNKFTIKSETSSREYTVSEKVTDGQPTGTWGCSCPAYRTKRTCKHLTAMGLTPAGQITGTSTRPASAASFADHTYSHYDTRDGFGSAQDWIRAAEGLASGRDQYRRQAPPPRRPRAASSHAEDMRLLGLTVMPATVKDLVRAMRKRAMIDHPDYGGTADAFGAMFAAYERLLHWYPKAA